MLRIQKMDLLISFYIGCIAISELMGSKTFPLFNIGSIQLSSSVAIFVVPLIYGINDVIIEVYGKERARSIVRSGLLVILFLLLFSIFATRLPSTPRFASTEKAYETILLSLHEFRLPASSLLRLLNS